MALTFTYEKLANQALIKLGSPTLSDITVDSAANVKEAVVMEALEIACVEEFLTDNPNKWHFNRVWKELTYAVDGTTEPDFQYTYAYDLPADFIDIVEIYNIPAAKYDIVGYELYVDIDPVHIKYLSGTVDYTKFIGPVGNAFSSLLASKAAMSLTKSTKLMDYWTNKYSQHLAAAMLYDTRMVWDSYQIAEPDVAGDR